MMLSEEAEETPSSDLLVELAAAFDVLSIGIPTSTPVMEITYDGGPGLVPRQTSDYACDWGQSRISSFQRAARWNDEIRL